MAAAQGISRVPSIGARRNNGLLEPPGKAHKYKYENLPMHFSVTKIENFIRNFFIVFLIFAQNIDCGYTLEPPPRLTICLLVNRSECPSLPRKNGSSPIIYTFISLWVYLVNRIKNFRACSGNVVKVKPGAHNLICS